MRVAILIGVSKYDTQIQLPGCAKDVAAMQEMISASLTFNDIVCFNSNTDSTHLKTELANLFKELKGRSVDELLFYFTGHGMYHLDDFYYALTDFDYNSIRQTSLQNSEIDAQIKALGPKLVIKMIDACQSGTAYIKGPDEIQKYYQKTIGGFDRCYFMHSSMNNQSSYGTSEISNFTKSILSAVKNFTQSEIRYKAIVDFISDEFEGNTKQTPFFVAQADFTEVFLTATDDVKNAIGKYITAMPRVQKPAKTERYKTKQDLLDIVKEDAEQYATHEEAKTLLNELQVLLENIELDKELSALYNKQIHAENLSDLPKKLFIGKWLLQNTHEYFAEPIFASEAYEEEVGSPAYLSITQMMKPNRTVIRHRQVLIGYDLTTDAPFKCLYINFHPLFPNLPHYTGIIAFIFSKKEIRFFHALAPYKELSWTAREISSGFDWETITYQIKETESIKDHIRQFFFDSTKLILDIIQKKFISKL